MIETVDEIKATLIETFRHPSGERIADQTVMKGGRWRWNSSIALEEGQRFFARLESAKGVPVERQVWFQMRNDGRGIIRP